MKEVIVVAMCVLICGCETKQEREEFDYTKYVIYSIKYGEYLGRAKECLKNKDWHTGLKYCDTAQLYLDSSTQILTHYSNTKI